MGIRRRILLGFISLGGLLFLSGVISLFELTKLGKTTQDLLDVSVQNIELSKVMLDAVQEQNTALLQIATQHNNSYDSVLINGRQSFEIAFVKAVSLHQNKPELDSIYLSKVQYNKIVSHMLSDTSAALDIKWFTDVYKTSYYDLTLAIKNFMIDTQHSMDRNTAKIESNAHRAIMPGIITLAVAIIIIIVFFYLIDIYYISPVVRINRGLNNYLKAKIPYKVTVTDGRDEVYELNKQIEELIGLLKTKKE